MATLTLIFKVKLVKKIYVIPCEYDNFWTIKNFSFKIDLCINHLKVSDFKKLVTLTLIFKVKLTFKLTKYLFWNY